MARPPDARPVSAHGSNARRDRTTRVDLQSLARLRLREAEVLFEAGLYDGASYLCGYAVECALKAVICKQLDVNEYPHYRERLRGVFASHHLEDLRFLAGLSAKIGPGRPVLWQNWSTVVAWKSEQRYDSEGSQTAQNALDMLNAVRSKSNGVLRWLARRW